MKVNWAEERRRRYIGGKVQRELVAGCAGYKILSKNQTECVKSDAQLSRELTEACKRFDKALTDLGLKYSL